MRSILITLALVAIGFSSSRAEAREIDLLQEVSRVMWSQRDNVPVPNAIGPFTVLCSKTGSFRAHWLPGNPEAPCRVWFQEVRAISVDVRYSEVKSFPLPESVIREDYSYVNCLDEDLSISDNLSLTFTESTTITKNTTITSGSGGQSQRGINVPLKFATFNVNETETVNFSRVEANGNSTSSTSQRTFTQPIVFDVPPRTIRTVTLEQRLSGGYVDFYGDVELEADVVARVGRDSKVIGKLSDYVPNKQDRIVTLSGRIENVRGTTNQRLVNDRPVDNLSAQCGTIASDLGENAGEALDFQDAEATLEFLSSTEQQVASQPRSELVTVPLLSGMTINTGNSVGTVKVRAQSLGPGFCAVTVRSNGNEARILAPPFNYSDWTSLFTHFGEVAASISVNLGCDVGILGEVQYWKKSQ